MWIAPTSAAENAFDALLRTPFGPWIVFAIEASPAAAALAFVFVLVVTILFSLLFLCAGNPKRMLRTVMIVGPVAGLYAAVHVGGLVTLLGWPILWTLRLALHLPSGFEAWAFAVFALNYISVGLVALSAIGLVIVLVSHGILSEPQKQQETGCPESSRQQERDATTRPQQLELSGIKRSGLSQSQHHSPIRESYLRIGLMAGCLFASPVFFASLFLLGDLNVLPLIYLWAAALVIFFVTVGVGQLLAWAVENFISKTQSEQPEPYPASAAI
jgi:hypothetical protein